MAELFRGRDLDRVELRRLVAQGSVERVAREVYRRVMTAVRPPPDPIEAWQAELALAVLSCRPGLAVSRATAAALWGFDGFEPPTPIDLNAGRTTGHRRAAVHRVRALEPLVTIGELDVTGPGRTLLELGAGLHRRRASANEMLALRPDELVELALESALRNGVVTEEDLFDLLSRCGATRAGSPVLEQVLGRRPFGAPATESYFETRGVQVLRTGGLPAGRRQVVIEDRRGRHIKRVDLLVGERVIVEFDGKAFHNFEGDHEIWSRLSAAGFTLLTFTYAQVTRRPNFVLGQVEQALS